MRLCTCSLLPRSAVCRILSLSEATLRLLIEYDLLPSPDCGHGKMWRRATVLRFVFRRQHDADFDSAVRELAGW